MVGYERLAGSAVAKDLWKANTVRRSPALQSGLMRKSCACVIGLVIGLESTLFEYDCASMLKIMQSVEDHVRFLEVGDRRSLDPETVQVFRSISARAIKKTRWL